MSSPKSDRYNEKWAAGIKGVLAIIVLFAAAGGSAAGFMERLVLAFLVAILLAICLGSIAGMFYLIRNDIRSTLHAKGTTQNKVTPKLPPSPFVWTDDEVQKHLSEIDWYQYEKFCAAILEAEGFGVVRTGGASPDGGVDLIAAKNETRTLIQCKHWKKWKVREPTIRQLLGSMVDFGVNRGAVFFSGECTQPAREFAGKHGIGLVDGKALSERALNALSPQTLTSILTCKDHHCPRCDSLMVWRTGDFQPFWGCSTFPKCRGTLKHPGPV